MRRCSIQFTIPSKQVEIALQSVCVSLRQYYARCGLSVKMWSFGFVYLLSVGGFHYSSLRGRKGWEGEEGGGGGIDCGQPLSEAAKSTGMF